MLLRHAARPLNAIASALKWVRSDIRIGGFFVDHPAATYENTRECENGRHQS